MPSSLLHGHVGGRDIPASSREFTNLLVPSTCSRNAERNHKSESADVVARQSFKQRNVGANTSKVQVQSSMREFEIALYW